MLEDENLAEPPLTSTAVDAWKRGFGTYRWVWSFLQAFREVQNGSTDGIADFGNLSVNQRPNMMMRSDNPSATVVIGFQLKESRLFVAVYSRGSYGLTAIKTRQSANSMAWRQRPEVRSEVQRRDACRALRDRRAKGSTCLLKLSGPLWPSTRQGRR